MATTPGDYFVGVTIGEGSFGVTLHGRHKASKRDVAIKVMDKASLRKRPIWLQMIRNEQRLLQQLNDCPHTVRLLASFHDQECVYLVMECCQGGDLEHVIRYYGRSTAPQWLESAAHYGLQILQGLQAIHEKGVIHADLKPSNLLLTRNGRILIADFGSAVSLSEHATVETTAVHGTADYASPEILLGKYELSEATDFWSFGCILFALLKGKSPFRAESHVLSAQAVLEYAKEASQGEQPRFQTLESLTPLSWRSLIKRLLHPDPRRRIFVGNERLNDSPVWDGVDLSRRPPILPPEPSWWTESQKSTMRDGKKGWMVFLL